MSSAQRVIKYIATAFAILLALGIVTAIVEVIFAVTGGFIGLDGKSIVGSQKYDYAVIDTIKLDAGSGSFTIESGDVEQIEVSYNKKSVKTTIVNDDTLRIESKSIFSLGSSNVKIRIIVPKEMDLNKLDLDVGAGELKVTDIICKEGKLHLGVGEIQVNNCTMTAASLDIGIGSLDFAGTSDNINLDIGIGEIIADLTGRADEYSIKADAGIGGVKVNGDKYREEIWKNSGANKKINADCGIGDIKIKIND